MLDSRYGASHHRHANPTSPKVLALGKVKRIRVMLRHRFTTPPKSSSLPCPKEASLAVQQHKAPSPFKVNGEVVIGALTFLSTFGPRRLRGHAQSALTIISVVALAARAFRRKT